MTQTMSRSGSSGSKSTSNTALVISWGSPVQGREQKAPQVLAEALTYLGALQERGEIQSYDAIALEPHGGQRNGLVVAYGDREQINRLRTSNEITRLVNRAQMVTKNVDVSQGQTGQAFEQAFQEWSQHTRDLS